MTRYNNENKAIKPMEEEEILFEKVTMMFSKESMDSLYKVMADTGISKKNIELWKILVALELYKGYYETIPGDIREVRNDLFKIVQGNKNDLLKITNEIKSEFQKTEATIKRLVKQAEQSSATGNAALNQFTEKAEKVVTTVSDKLEERLYKALPLSDFKEAGKVLSTAGENIKGVDAKLQRSIKTLRWRHYGAIAGIAVAIILGSWIATAFYYKSQYEIKLAEARIVMAEKMESDNNALIELSKSNKKIMMITGDDADRITKKKGLKIFAIENSNEVLNLTGIGDMKLTGIEFK